MKDLVIATVPLLLGVLVVVAIVVIARRSDRPPAGGQEEPTHGGVESDWPATAIPVGRYGCLSCGNLLAVVYGDPADNDGARYCRCCSTESGVLKTFDAVVEAVAQFLCSGGCEQGEAERAARRYL